ncbi:hypothetical protein D3P09_09235 [Paenibacillus pinisoli]|uniref:Uncharacterized protein n=1 Tax=Paenibacillus pinisoli TaxID=1276110 RepID=A0A3A6PJZ9_9BACL|nr:hypothetical protein [Paenibacillus pinisoli]RJX39588.1 hypothetical protein D3P09_09235 [Paenibacillus pinisoli]
MSNVSEMVNKLINSTDKGTLKWRHISNIIKLDEELDKYVTKNKNNILLTSSEYVVNEKKTFYSEYKDSFFFFFTKIEGGGLFPSGKEFFIIATKIKNGKVFELNNVKEHQSDLYRLLNLIERQTNRVDELINDFLQDDSV